MKDFQPKLSALIAFFLSFLLLLVNLYIYEDMIVYYTEECIYPLRKLVKYQASVAILSWFTIQQTFTFTRPLTGLLRSRAMH